QDPPPTFNVDGVQILFTNIQGLYFVCTTRFNVSTFMTFELLDRIASLIRDFCGILSEECVRLNSSLIYELLDEDYGYPQTTSTDQLKLFVYEEPIPPISKPTAHSRDEGRYKQNEVFIDIIERLVASFASDVDFEGHRQLIIFPQEGEITAMIYRISSDISLPFRIFPQILDVPGSPNKLDVIIRIRADFPEDKIATNCTVIVPLPHITQRYYIFIPELL
ncbi:8430_t:CDS:2, partial [Racocetra fulgida]